VSIEIDDRTHIFTHEVQSWSFEQYAAACENPHYFQMKMITSVCMLLMPRVRYAMSYV